MVKEMRMLQLSKEAKYLEIIVYSKLSYMEEERRRESWGISPKLTHWIFTATVRPILMYLSSGRR